MKQITLLLLSVFFLSYCATFFNDATVPVTFTFSDGSSGRCKVSNKRISLDLEIPGTHNIRRSDDSLVWDCETEDGKKAFGNIKSEMESAKFLGSVFFFDLGITDAITYKHRTYTPNFVIPVEGDAKK